MISKKGIGNVTVDGLVEQITPTARGICSPVHYGGYNNDSMLNAASVPDFVKKELLEHIRTYLDQKQ